MKTPIFSILILLCVTFSSCQEEDLTARMPICDGKDCYEPPRPSCYQSGVLASGRPTSAYNSIWRSVEHRGKNGKFVFRAAGKYYKCIYKYNQGSRNVYKLTYPHSGDDLTLRIINYQMINYRDGEGNKQRAYRNVSGTLKRNGKTYQVRSIFNEGGNQQFINQLRYDFTNSLPNVPNIILGTMNCTELDNQIIIKVVFRLDQFYAW